MRLELSDLNFRLIGHMPGGNLVYQDEATGAQASRITIRGRDVIQYATRPATYADRSPKVYDDVDEFLDALEVVLDHRASCPTPQLMVALCGQCAPCKVTSIVPRHTSPA